MSMIDSLDDEYGRHEGGLNGWVKRNYTINTRARSAIAGASQVGQPATLSYQLNVTVPIVTAIRKLKG